MTGFGFKTIVSFFVFSLMKRFFYKWKRPIPTHNGSIKALFYKNKWDVKVFIFNQFIVFKFVFL